MDVEKLKVFNLYYYRGVSDTPLIYFFKLNPSELILIPKLHSNVIRWEVIDLTII
jgi:hypothetical protein